MNNVWDKFVAEMIQMSITIPAHSIVYLLFLPNVTTSCFQKNGHRGTYYSRNFLF